MPRPITVGAALLVTLSLAACGRLREDSGARSMAIDAYNEARRAAEALDDGSASGTTMGAELEEANQRAEHAEAAIQQLQYEMKFRVRPD